MLNLVVYSRWVSYIGELDLYMQECVMQINMKIHLEWSKLTHKYILKINKYVQLLQLNL